MQGCHNLRKPPSRRITVNVECDVLISRRPLNKPGGKIQPNGGVGSVRRWDRHCAAPEVSHQSRGRLNIRVSNVNINVTPDAIANSG